MSDMQETSRFDSQFGRRLTCQYGIDAAQSLASASRSGAEIGIVHLRYDLPHLFVLEPLPIEDAFLLGVEIDAGGSRRIVRDGESLQMGLQQEGAVHIADLSEPASAYVCRPFQSMFFHLPRAALDAFAEEVEEPRVEGLCCDAGTLDPVIANLGRAVLPVLARPRRRIACSWSVRRWR